MPLDPLIERDSNAEEIERLEGQIEDLRADRSLYDPTPAQRKKIEAIRARIEELRGETFAGRVAERVRRGRKKVRK